MTTPTPDDVRALVERLRQAQIRSPVGKDWIGIFGESATALDSLLARVEELETKLRRAKKLERAAHGLVAVLDGKPITVNSGPEGKLIQFAYATLRAAIDAAMESER